MSLLPNLLRSLLLSAIFGFLTPVCVIGVIWASFALASAIPGLDDLGKTGVNQLTAFLATFGGHSVLKGILTIGFVCSLVGMLFDSYTFYRYQKLNS